MPSLFNRDTDAEFADALRSLANLSQSITIMPQDLYGDYFVSFVTSESSAPVTLKSSSKPQLTLLILLLVKHWDEMSLRPVDRRRSEHQESGSDDL